MRSSPATLASGLRPAFAFSVGVVLGDIVLMLLAVFGLAAVAQAMGDWFVVVKIAGGIYLVWLGWKLWTSEPAEPRSDQLVAARQFRRNLVGGFVLTLGNPKAIAFYAAFLPTFIDLRTITAADIAVIAAVIAGVLTTTNMTYGLLAARARLLVQEPARHAQLQSRRRNDDDRRRRRGCSAVADCALNLSPAPPVGT